MNSDTKVCFDALDENGKPFGWVVIDSMVNKRSHGGLRISPNVTTSELQTLAYKMTLKFGFIGIANGGAKAGIIGNPEATAEERMSLLIKFSNAIKPVIQSGYYQPHADMGTTRTEIQKAFGILDRRREPSREQSGFFTGLTVLLCATVVAEHIGKKIEGMTIAIEGFGKVGSAVAMLLAEMGAKILAVSTSRGAIYCQNGLPVQRLISLSEKYQSAFVEEFQDADKIGIQELFTLPVDMVCPCGAGWSIDTKIAKSIRAAMIVSGANCPVLPEAEPLLLNAGIVNLPDFVSNCGGVLGGTMFYAGMEPDEIRSLIETTMTPRLTKLLKESWDRGRLICDVAERDALQRFNRLKEQAEKPGWKQKFLRIGNILYKHHVVPRFVMRRITPSYFNKQMR